MLLAKKKNYIYHMFLLPMEYFPIQFFQNSSGVAALENKNVYR